jgi:zinc/manganese transport system substrate-binding protein
MKHVRILTVLVFILLIPAFGSTRAAQGSSLRVIATTTILQDIAQNVAGDIIPVAALVPTDGDVHAFDPTPADVQKIADANLILVNGAGLEPFLDRLIADSGTQGKVVAVSQGVGIQQFLSIEERASSGSYTPSILGISGSYQCGVPQPGEEIGNCDPHLWQNVTNVIVYTVNIRDALIAADPANSDAYNTNAGNYIVKLQKLDADIFAGLQNIPPANRVLVTNHDALGYFAARYGFTIAGVVLPGGATNQEPNPQQVAALIDTIKAQSVKAIFLENISSDKLASQIADQSGVTVVQALYTDALGKKGTPGDTYIGMMYANLTTIQNALQ